MEEQRRERAHEEHDRQRAEREHEVGVRVGHRERLLAAAKVAEDQRGSRLGGLLDPAQDVVELQERLVDAGQLQEEEREDELEREPGDDRAPGHLPALLAEEPGQTEQAGDAGYCLKHCSIVRWIASAAARGSFASRTGRPTTM